MAPSEERGLNMRMKFRGARALMLFAIACAVTIASTVAGPIAPVSAKTEVYLSGRVTAEGTGKPLQWVTVQLRARPDGTWKPIAGFGATGADGKYLIPIQDLDPGQYYLVFGEPTYSPYRTESWDGRHRGEEPDYFTIDPAVPKPGMNASLTRGPEIPTDRIAGSDRYATAVEISKSLWDGSEEPAGILFIANGLNFPDALSAAPLAASYGGPLLLTAQNELPAVTRAEIIRLNPQLVVVAGGTGVVSDKVYAELESLVPEVDRVAGADRYETSRLLAEHALDLNKIYLATGRGYADALSAAATAGSQDQAVLLVDGNLPSLDPATIDFLNTHGTSQVAIVGGTGVVSQGIEDELKTDLHLLVQRYAGANRFTTSIMINSAYFPDPQVVFLATGRGFPDALAGAAFAGYLQSPLYLSDTNCLPDGLASPLLRSDATIGATLFGGTGVLGSGVANLQTCRIPGEVRPD